MVDKNIQLLAAAAAFQRHEKVSLRLKTGALLPPDIELSNCRKTRIDRRADVEPGTNGGRNEVPLRGAREWIGSEINS